MTIIEAIKGVLGTKGIAIIETLPGFWGNRGNGIYFRGTKPKYFGEQRQCWGTGNIENTLSILENRGTSQFTSREQVAPLGGPRLYKYSTCFLWSGNKNERYLYFLYISCFWEYSVP